MAGSDLARRDRRREWPNLPDRGTDNPRSEEELGTVYAERWQRTWRRYLGGYRRGKKERWAFPVKALVRHPKYGEIQVPGASKYAAILCAAEQWGCKFLDIHDAEVWAIPETEKNEPV